MRAVSFRNNLLVNLPEVMSQLDKLEIVDLTGNPLEVRTTRKRIKIIDKTILYFCNMN